MVEPLRQRLPKNAGISPAEAKRYLAYIGALGSVQIHGCILCGAASDVAHVKFGEPCLFCNGEGFLPYDIHEASDETPTVPCGDCQITGWRYGKLPSLRQHRWTVPLCPAEHRLYKGCQHDGSEQKFWQELDILSVCKSLQDCYPDLERAAEILRRCHD